MTFGDLKAYCEENKISYKEIRHKYNDNEKSYGPIKKLVITKKRAIKLTLTWGRMSWSFWDPHRRSYKKKDARSFNFYQFDEDKEITDGWWKTLMELLETEAFEKKDLGEFPLDPLEFTDNVISQYTNGLVKADLYITQAYVSGIVKVTNRGTIKEIQPKDDCECWFLVDGKGKCASPCGGRPTRLIYDGESKYVIVDKTDKAYKVSEDQKELSHWDKVIIDSALKLFLTLREKDQSG